MGLMRSKPDLVMWIYLPSGRRVGFMRARDEATARAMIDEMLNDDRNIPGREKIHWRDHGYVLRRARQRPPGKAKRKRRSKHR